MTIVEEAGHIVLFLPTYSPDLKAIAKQAKVDMIWVAGRSPTLVSHSLRDVAMNLKATTLTYLAIYSQAG